MSQIRSWSSYSTPGERRCMYLPWKWSYRSSTQNIKQCLVCCLLKNRTNNMEAKQHQGCTVRHTQKKNLYLEWNSIFLNPKCVPSSPPTLFSSLVLLLDMHYSFVNGLPPCSHPRIRYSIKTWGILLWLLVSCFLWKIQPPLSHTNTLMYSTAHHTPNRAGLGSAAKTPIQIYISLWVFVLTILAPNIWECCQYKYHTATWIH